MATPIINLVSFSLAYGLSSLSIRRLRGSVKLCSGSTFCTFLSLPSLWVGDICYIKSYFLFKAMLGKNVMRNAP